MTSKGAFPIEIIPIDYIDVGEQLIRSSSLEDGIEELALDIASHGLLQPIGVTPKDGGRYQLLWGYRRLQAFRYLKRPGIPAHIVPPEQVDSVKSIAIRENIHRSQMSLKEEVDTVRHLHEHEGLSPAQIAERIGKTRDWVMRRLAIPGLPQDVIEALMDGRISLAVAEALARCPSQDGRQAIMIQAQLQRWPATVVAEAVKAWENTPSVEDAVEAGLQVIERQRIPRAPTVSCDLCLDKVHYSKISYIKVCDGCLDLIHSLPRVGEDAQDVAAE